MFNVGASECVALLRFFGVRAQVVDFAAHLLLDEGAHSHSSKSSNCSSENEDESVLRAVQRWLTRYYHLSDGPSSSSSSSQSSEVGFRPTLFLQHAGHSRTIIGK